MWARLKATIIDFIQQADLVLLGLCCLAGGYGLVLIYSASHRLSSNLRLVAVQGVAIVLVCCAISSFPRWISKRLPRSGNGFWASTCC